MNTKNVSSLFVLPWLTLLLSVGLLAGPYETKPPKDDAATMPDLSGALEYRMVGPFRGGRVTAVSGAATQPPTLYMGAAGGGVWRTTDHGISYENVSDGFFSVGSIGAVEVAPSNPEIIYVGTGSACIRSNVSPGRGVYRSSDGAASWQFVGLPEAGAIGAIRVHPSDPNLVYVAALGHPFGSNPERGVYRSRDGGATWEKALYVSEQTGAVDLALNPRNPMEIYAAMWRAERRPWTIISGGVESGVYKTVDGGDTWKKLSAGLPAGVVGRIGLALSPADPNRLFALIEAADEQSGLYRSDNGGQSFQRVNDRKSLLYRPFYYTHVTADPVDANTVYVSNEGFYKSTDGGRSFSRLRTPHGDNHALWIHPHDPDFLFQANDGGVNVSRDGGKTWSAQDNQATAELYHVVVDNQFPYRLYGEQQDNSTISVPSLPPTAARPLDPKQFWYSVAGCETGPIAVHPENPNIVYGGCKGRFSRFNRETGQEKQYWVYPHYNYGHAAGEMPFRFQRTAPIEISPHDPRVIYHASHVVHRTVDEGVNWEIISPDLTARPEGTQGYSGEPITRDITGEEIYSAIYQLRESPLEQGLLWAGSNDGLVHVSRDGGRNWKNVTPAGLPAGGRVQTIEPSPHQPAKALIAIYRFLLDDYAPYIYRTDDYGETWRRLTDGENGIPADHPTRVVREDPSREGLYYAGTEFGMFYSMDGGNTWRSLQMNLPATPVTDIRVHRKDLVLSTMGRSFWILDDVSPLHEMTDGGLGEAHHLFQPRDHHRLRWSPTRSRDDGAVPETPPFGAMFHYLLAGAEERDVKLEILDADGGVVRSFDSQAPPGSEEDDDDSAMRPPGRVQTGPAPSAEPGLHRFVWDLRYPGPEALQSQTYGGRGPMAPPGLYQIRLTAGDWSQTRSFQLLMDPRVAGDGVAQEDLNEQFDLLMRIRDRISDTRLTVDRIRSARRTLTLQAQGTGKTADRASAAIQAMREVEEKLLQTKEGKVGAQLKPMLVEQLNYLYGMLLGADQKPGRDAYLRLEDIEKELAGHQEDLRRILVDGPDAGRR